jgi:uncharacterized protein YgiM (DUF1202 family)
MKKMIYLILFVAAFLLTGCTKKDQMVDFIPTAAPTQGVIAPDSSTSSSATPTPKVAYVGDTITKYVKLTQYNDVLNIRSTPSTDAEVVGFLVHTEKVNVIKITDGWASFVYHNAICYVNAAFLVDKKPQLLPTPTPAPDKKSSSKKKVNLDI